VLAAIFAHTLAWAAFLFFVLSPVYQAESNSVDLQTGLTLIEVNGYKAMPLILIPVVVTGVGTLAAFTTGWGETLRGRLLWGSTIVLTIYAILVFTSVIGIFFVPPLLGLLGAALIGPEEPAPKARGYR